MSEEKNIKSISLDLTRNSEESFLEDKKSTDLQKGLLDKANSIEFIGGLFLNIIDPPFKAFLKRIILKKYPAEISKFNENDEDLDIYNDDNDKLYKDFIIESAHANGISDKDYLFDSTTLNIGITIRICFGDVYKSDSEKVLNELKEKGIERQKKPISRENVFFLAFALNLTVDELNELLIKGLKQQGIIFKNPYEVISWWALKSSSSVKFEKFKELKKFVQVIESNGENYENTDYYQNEAEDIGTEEELKEYLRGLSGWGRQRIRGKADGEKIVVYQSKRAKDAFLKLYDKIVEIKSEIINQPSYQIQKKLIEDSEKIEKNDNEIEKVMNNKDRLKSLHRLSVLIEGKLNEKIEKLYKEVDKIDKVGPQVCWEDLAKTKWLKHEKLDEDVFKMLSKELYGESFNTTKLNGKKFPILNRNSLRLNSIEKIKNGSEEITRDHLMILAFYHYVLLLKNKYYENWIGDSKDEEYYSFGSFDDGYLIDSYDDLPSWYDERKRRGVLDDKELFKDFKDVTDKYLREAGFGNVYLPNSMDSFVFMCLLAEDPILCFRRFINLEI